MSKYRNMKITADGLTFDSRKEYFRWHELSLLEKAGVISGLQRQVRYELLPSQKVDGKVVERPVHYIADFVYQEDGQTVVEDIKPPATKTPVYVVKRKLMLQKHGIRIRET